VTLSRHRIFATLPSGAALNVIDGSLKLDESRSPYATASLTVTTPDDLTTIDPRVDTRIFMRLTGQTGGFAFVFDLSERWGGKLVSDLSERWGGLLVSDMSNDRERKWNAAYSEGTTRPASLGLRSRETRTDGTTRLELASDEALLQDLRNTQDVGFINQPTVRAFINAVFSGFLSPTQSMHQFALADGADDAPMPVGTNDSDPTGAYQYVPVGVPYWDFMSQYVQQANLRLWCDELGIMRLTQRDFTVPGYISVRKGINMTDATDTIDRASDEWADNVIMEWAWAADGIQQIAQSIWPAFPASPGSPGKTLFMKIDAPAPFGPDSPMSARPAAQIWNRIRTRGHQIPAAAVSDYTATPGQTAYIEFPGSPLQSGLVESVIFTAPAGEMQIVSRNLVTS